MSITACSEGVSASYSGALDHYLSPERRDGVKVQWEEPTLAEIFDDALSYVPSTGPLRVIDIGCGIGDGLRLLRSAPCSHHRTHPAGSVRYTGVDLNADLLDAARRVHGATGDAEFICADVRDWSPAAFDLVIATGVPYSHLTPAELEQVLTGLFATARQQRQPTAIVIDVLGRYSVEWTSRWDQQRWPYRMSFFSTDETVASTEMTCYSGAELHSVISTAADRAGCVLDGVECHDRSIGVGRHTTTAEFASGLRLYRGLVNGLLDPDVTADWDQLWFDVSVPEAPEPVTTFFAEWAERWNTMVSGVRDLARSADSEDHVAGVLQPMLAHGLKRLERTHQRGLGVGHSLTAVAYAQPAPA